MNEWPGDKQASPPELRGPASREAWARRGRQRLALLEAALPGQGTLFLLIFPLLVLLLLFLHLVRKERGCGEVGSRGQRRPSVLPGWAPCPHLQGHLPVRPPACGGPGRGCPPRWACGAPHDPRTGCSGARCGGHCMAVSEGWRRPSVGTPARLQRDECGRGVAHTQGRPLTGPFWGLSQGRRPYPGPGHCEAV